MITTYPFFGMHLLWQKEKMLGQLECLLQVMVAQNLEGVMKVVEEGVKSMWFSEDNSLIDFFKFITHEVHLQSFLLFSIIFMYCFYFLHWDSSIEFTTRSISTSCYYLPNNIRLNSIKHLDEEDERLRSSSLMSLNGEGASREEWSGLWINSRQWWQRGN